MAPHKCSTCTGVKSDSSSTVITASFNARSTGVFFLDFPCSSAAKKQKTNKRSTPLCNKHRHTTKVGVTSAATLEILQI